jgi:methylmalonyl-CoA carboxyltransferase small subunit
LKLRVVVDENAYDVEVEDGDELDALEPSMPEISAIQSAVLISAKVAAASAFDESKVCRSPLAGVVARLQVSPGQAVKVDELLLVLEAMKMEIKIAAQSAGTVKSIDVATGDAVRLNQILLFFE